MTSEAGKKAAHTPGPWMVAKMMGWGSGSASGGQVQVMRPTGRYLKAEDGSFYEEPPTSGTPICAFYTSGLPPCEGFANGRLIAAAPEMYAALQCAANVLFLLKDEVAALGCNAQNVQEKCRAALASASPDLERALAQKSEER